LKRNWTLFFGTPDIALSASLIFGDVATIGLIRFWPTGKLFTSPECLPRARNSTNDLIVKRNIDVSFVRKSPTSSLCPFWRFLETVAQSHTLFIKKKRYLEAHQSPKIDQNCCIKNGCSNRTVSEEGVINNKKGTNTTKY